MSTIWPTTPWRVARPAAAEDARPPTIWPKSSTNFNSAAEASTAATSSRLPRNYRNILAVLPGSDPELKNQVLVVGAHYDHVGYGTKYNSRGPIGQIHNGADDNASGTSGLLELAQALTMLPQHPKRSILLVFWDAEERACSDRGIGSPSRPSRWTAWPP